MSPFVYCPGMVGGSWDTLTGECSVLVPIHVLSRDGQSISGSWDTLTRGGAVPIHVHVLSRDGHLEIVQKLVGEYGVDRPL